VASEIGVTRRRETKYYVNYAQYMLLSTLLKSVLDLDRHSNEEGFYTVRSLYFDSLDGKDMLEKDAGLLHRRKIRLRSYGEASDFFKFETKEKVNKHTVKQSISLTKQEAELLVVGDYERLIPDHLRLYDHMKSYGYRPSALIDYEREAYVSDLFNLRINFDMNIRGTSLSDQVFERNVAMVPIITPGMYILEVKHDGHIPDIILELLAQVDLTQVSFSKYYYGMQV